MATLKKPLKKKDAGKPSTVLIIFLVFFILLSIGLGVAAYYGYEGQNKLTADAKAAKTEADTRRKLDDYRMAVIHLLGNSVGRSVDPGDEDRAVAAIEDLLKQEGGKYANEKDRKLFADWQAEVVKNNELAFDGKKFVENYRVKYAAALKEKKEAETQLEVTRKALKEEQAKYAAYEKKNEDYAAARTKQIATMNTALLNRANQKTDEFLDLLKLNKTILDQKLELEGEVKKERDNVAIEKARYDKLLDEKKRNTQEVVKTRSDNEQHALFLDLSKGVPLWDRAVGKITRVELERRQLLINIGSAAGVRPELTFNIFADDGKGHADKFMKGTCEVIRIIDSQTSLCRITSVFDAAGREIANNSASGQATREVEVAIREGDLVFNMFWNSHVAVAGILNFTNIAVDAPSEQMRNIEMFGQLLARMGIHTDAYLDLNDGQVKGAMNGRTRFLVLGDQAYPKDPKDEAQKERAKMINDAIAAMKKDAVEKGIYLISAENFTIAAGYRRPRNANDTAAGKFISTLPLAGAGTPGLVIQRDRPAEVAPMPPMPEKKEEKKEEKKLPENGKEKDGK